MDILQHLVSLLQKSVTGPEATYEADATINSISAILRDKPVTAQPENIQASLRKLHSSTDEQGLPANEVIKHVIDELSIGLARGHSGPRFFGFVTGGSLPVAQNDTISTALEFRTLELILDLLSIPRDTFTGRSLTTGATASNILGLALRDPSYSTSDHGYPADVEVKVLTDRHHASIEKAAAIIGIGRSNVISLITDSGMGNRSFATILKQTLGDYKSSGKQGDFTDMTGVREICTEYDAWLHIDAAFGALAALTPEYSHLREELASADSITTDATSASSDSPPNLEWVQSVPSPLHMNLENSRRFIALPLYCAVISMGRSGYRDIVQRNIQFARSVASWMSSPEEGGRWFEVLNLRLLKSGVTSVPLNVVLFRPKDGANVPQVYRSSMHTQPNGASAALIRDINATKKMYVTPGGYPGGAIRIAVSNWMTGYQDDGSQINLELPARPMSEQTSAADNKPQLYSTREDWKDVTPIEQSDLANPLVPIFYPPDCLILFQLDITNDMPNRQYRYDTLMELQYPLEEEMKLMDELALLHLKHYQVWHHRKLITLKLKKPGRELTFIAKVLAVDAKNYHTWAYRQWLLTYFDDDDLWQFEMPFVNLMLDQDVRNNSAWHHRFFVAFDSGVRTGDEDREAVLRKELNYVKEKISIAPNNLSAWNYLRGILDKAKRNYGTLREFVLPYT
ncbi:16435_t:CDS:2, partial [Acaulospora colombiana]